MKGISSILSTVALLYFDSVGSLCETRILTSRAIGTSRQISIPPRISSIAMITGSGSHSFEFGAGSAISAWAQNAYTLNNNPGSLNNAVAIGAGRSRSLGFWAYDQEGQAEK